MSQTMETPIPRRIYASLEEAMGVWKATARSFRFNPLTANTDKNSKDVIYQRRLACNLGGKKDGRNKKEGLDPSKRRNRQSVKLGCEFKAIIKLDQSDGSWSLESISDHHNHGPLERLAGDPRNNKRKGARAALAAAMQGDEFEWEDMDMGGTPKPSINNPRVCPHPELRLPEPALTQDFRMAVTLNPKITVGPTPFGTRNWISFTGGKWLGSWGSGIVLPGGQDNQLVLDDGTAHLETSYILQTYDNPPAHIVIKTNGWRTGPPEVLAKLADPEQADDVDPLSYKFRLFIEMETGDERYRDKIQYGMWVGSGMRKGAEVIYDAYRIS